MTGAPALASAQSAPVCLESHGAKDAAYSAKPIAAPGCALPARYDVSIVGGCVGVYGAQELTLEDGLFVASGPGWGATIDTRGPDPVVTPSCAGATPVALTPVAALDTSTVSARAALLDDPRPDVRAAALEATARDQEDAAACAGLARLIDEAPSYGFARESEAKRAHALRREECRGEGVEVSDVPPPPLPTNDSTPPEGATTRLAAEAPADVTHDEDTSYEANAYEREDIQPTPDGPGGMGYSFNVGWLIGDRELGPDPAISLWGGLKFYPSDDSWAGFFTPGIQLTLADTRLEVVPTLRVGMGYLLSTELEGGPDALVRTFTAVEFYGILGLNLPLGNDDFGVRTGVGIASPIGLLVSLVALGELEMPLPNGIELHVDHDLLTSDQTWRMNLTVGF